MIKRINGAIVMAFLVAVMSLSVAAASSGGNGNPGIDPNRLPTWSG